MHYWIGATLLVIPSVVEGMPHALLRALAFKSTRAEVQSLGSFCFEYAHSTTDIGQVRAPQELKVRLMILFPSRRLQLQILLASFLSLRDIPLKGCL
jgi:hypothetical protein